MEPLHGPDAVRADRADHSMTPPRRRPRPRSTVLAAKTGLVARTGLVAKTGLVAVVALLVGACSNDDTSRATGRADRSASTTSTSTPDASTVAEVLGLDRPVVLAHAGGDDIHPHDTPFGFDRSAAAGVDVLDMDVQLSSDGVLVVQHDDTVDRTTEAE